MKRVIFHIDVNSAFLSWEASYRVNVLGYPLDLRTVPSAVGGDVAARNGIILAKSFPAKRFHIKTGEAIFQAKQKCRDLIVVPPHYDLYDRCSRAFVSLLKEYTPVVEQYSVDEIFADMTGTERLYGSAAAIAQTIKERMKAELGFTANIGISSNKLLAKMASDYPLPDSVYTIWPEEVPKKLWPLPTGDLFFVGRASAKKLRSAGISTVGELASMDKGIIQGILGKKHGELVYEFANGWDDSPVEPEAPPNKGYGNSLTTPFDIEDIPNARRVLLALCETVGRRLRADRVMAGGVSVSIKDCGFQTMSHQMQLPGYTDVTNELFDWAARLYERLWDGSAPVRQIGVHTFRISADTGRQYDLFDGEKYERYGCLDRAVDRIREEYGDDSVMRGCFLKSPIYHLSGGISPEKRRIVYRN